MATVIDNYVNFFLHQKQEIIKEYNKIKDVSLKQLFRESKIIIGRIDRVNSTNGHVIIEIDRHLSVRLKTMMNCTLLSKKCFEVLGNNYSNWSISFGEFNKPEHSIWHQGLSDIMPMYFTESQNPDKAYVGCSSLSVKMYSDIEKLLGMGKTINMLLFDPFPPTEYLENLAVYTKYHPDNEYFNINEEKKYEDWHPIELEFNPQNTLAIPETIKTVLEKEDKCILQGPPGTGKSFTIANIIANYLENEKSVCVTTMANKGLIELVKQSPLKKYLEERKVYKTNLSSDEARAAQGLQYIKRDLLAPKGSLVCSTYYVLSKLFNIEKEQEFVMPSFDLIIIEEASQAFLSTLAAFCSLGTKCLIVGDPMQLSPIVINLSKNSVEYKIWKVQQQCDGLMNIALNQSIPSYRITTTFRLTEKSANLTKEFYGNNFRSVQPNPVDFSNIKSPYFPKEGQPIVVFTEDGQDGICSDKAIAIIDNVLGNLKESYPDSEIAIISPFKDTVKLLQKRFYTENQDLDLTIDTIDRIQGMNVDYAIVYFPLAAVSFAFAENRFSVATSRSKNTTLIISDGDFRNFPALPPRSKAFLSRCVVLSSDDFDEYNSTDSTINNCSSKRVETIMGNGIELHVTGKIDLSKFERKKVEIKAGVQNYYVIDTNVFINSPEIISRIDKQYPIILAAKVVDELDKMKIKLDTRGKQNAENAIRSINRQMGQRDIRMELSNVSLLPEDFDKRSPDNMILSVALKYKSGNPILLTSDNGLQLKAKGLGLSTISLKEFIKR